MPQQCLQKECAELAVLRGFCQPHYLKHSYSTVKLMKRPSEVPELGDEATAALTYVRRKKPANS